MIAFRSSASSARPGVGLLGSGMEFTNAVEGLEHRMSWSVAITNARFRPPAWRAQRRPIPDFTDKDDLRVLSYRVADGLGEACASTPNLALSNRNTILEEKVMMDPRWLLCAEPASLSSCWSNAQAVVLFPCPAAPVTSNSPRGSSSTNSANVTGNWRSSSWGLFAAPRGRRMTGRLVVC